MALSHSPKIITEGLVFYSDMSNRQKSWKGEPTTNLIPSPEHNGRFTTSNGWGTYNTNQYNGAQYFSIGTVSSVSGNIVTMSSSHPLRTFDVVRPQTTGGGLTAGTDYLIKRISSTQFSVYAYNGNQTGAQGYIDPATGFHKVHESIALDQKISINATSFPTMWWGAPHLPNSGLVKEIVQGVGPQGQSVMRLHINRTDGVVDGMAYGVYVPVTAGQTINVSYWQRTNYPGKNLGYSTYFGPGGAYSSSYTSNSLEWERVSFQWTASVNFSFYQYWWPSGSTDGPYWFDIADLQVEVNTQSGDTPFVIGTRSNTQAILDLTNNNTITANSLTYAADGTFSFNGSSNYADCGNSTSLQHSSSITMSAWVNPVSSTALGNIMAKNSNSGYRFRIQNGSLWWYVSGNNITGGSVPNNIWSFVTVTGDNTGLKAYVNGVLVASNTTVFTPSAPTVGNLYLGCLSPSSEPFNGTISSGSIYNRALTAAEVQQNFQALRGRYGI